jgi:hypothetical protein
VSLVLPPLLLVQAAAAVATVSSATPGSTQARRRELADESI